LSSGSPDHLTDVEALTMAVPPNLHPTDEELRADCLGQLDDLLAEVVHKHLEDCADCRARVAEMSSDSSLERLPPEVCGEGPEPYVPQISVSFEPGRTSVLASLAESVGGLPRVSLRDTDPGEEPSPLVKPGSSEMPFQEDRSGRYQLLGEIARGGMGAVLRGRDGDIGRDLAIKVLLGVHKDKPELIRRFVEEAQIGGQLQHPGVVPIYDVGTFADRRPFFTMKLVKGQTLAHLLQGRKDPADGLPRFLSIFEQVCQTMAYAHTRGVIHRDLKPSNIMVGGFGEVQVMDWGLAKVLPRGDDTDFNPARSEPEVSVIATVRSGSDADASTVGSVLGTPAYMAPEQARGDVDEVDERADVFGLGAILCETLTGLPPVTGRSRGEVMRKAARGELSAAFDRLDGCGAEPVLIDLTKHCLAAERESRPRSARELADAVTAYLSGVQERLRRTEVARAEANARAAEERKRRKLTLALAASIIGTILIGGGAWYTREQQRQERAARVDLALREAEILYDQARQAGDDQSRWIEARDAARSVERVLADARDEAIRRRVTGLAREVTSQAGAAGDDRKLLDKLIDIRSAQADDPDGSVADADYAAAFREAGLDVTALPSAEAAARMTARPARVAASLAAALDDWASVRRGRLRDEAGASQLTQIARVADPDSWRIQFRDALGVHEGPRRLDTIRALARSAEIDELPPASLNLLGSALLAAGDSTAAEKILRTAQRRFPGDVWLNHNLALCLEKLARREEAIRFYTAARSLRPETAHELAHALDGKGESDEAVAVFQDLARLRPGDGRHLVCLGRVLQVRGRTQEAIPILDAAISALRLKLRERTGNVGLSNSLGLALMDQGRLQDAVAVYRGALRLNPGAAEVHDNLGLALQNLGKPEEAIAEHRIAIRLKPDHATFYSNLSIALIGRGRYDEAIVEVRDAIRLQPDFAQAHVILGNALRQRKQIKEAIAEFLAAIRLKPDFAVAHKQLGILMCDDTHEYQAAVTEFRKVLELTPTDADARFNLGNALVGEGKIAEATAEFREAIRLKRDYAKAHYGLGLVLGRQGRDQEAIASYRQAIRLQPDLGPAHNNLSAALLREGKLEEAAAELQQALRLNPDNAAAHCNLGEILGAQGKPDEAIAEYRHAIRLAPDLVEPHHNLATVLSEQGKWEEAITEYHAAIRLAPDLFEPHFGLGHTLHRHGNGEEASAEYRKAIRIQPESAEAHCNLGQVLRDQGRYTEALAVLRRGHELGSKQPRWPFPSAQWVRDCERLVASEAKLGAILRAGAEPDNAQERLLLAQMCYHKQWHVAAARFLGDAFKADGKLAEDMQAGNRYNAACSAALAGSGKSKDGPPLGQEAQQRLRRQALDWLKADLAYWTKQVETSRPQAKVIVSQHLQHWKTDPDLAGIRDREALKRLPEDERNTWGAFWGNVDSVLGRAR
jgi:serine/threonine-protein kinase